jgi:hypothetical protein
MRRKGMALNPAYVQLNEASAALRKEIERRKQNAPHKRHVVRFLMDKEFRISVDGEVRPLVAGEQLLRAVDGHDVCEQSKRASK